MTRFPEKNYLLLLIAFVFLVSCDYGRMWETPAVRPHEEEIMEMEEGIIPFDGGEVLYRAAKGEDLKSPVEMDNPEIVKLGRSLYFTYCAQCHGKYHDGNGTVGMSFHPLPTDLRSVEIQSAHGGKLFKSISYGVPNGRQPPLATTVEITDRWRIIAYVKSLGLRE